MQQAGSHRRSVMDYRGRVNRNFSKCYELIEGKYLEVVGFYGYRVWDKIQLTEKSDGRVFQGSTSYEGGGWISKLLCQLCLGETLVGSVFRFADNGGSMLGSLKENRRGLFLQIQFMPKNGGFQRRVLCIPAGNQFSGWANLGGKMGPLLAEINGSPVQRIPTLLDFPAPPLRRRGNATFAQICANKSQADDFNPVQPLKMNHPWWAATAVCLPSNANPDWIWVQAKVREVFGQIGFKVTGDGKALIFFNSVEELNKLLSMPPLSSWDGSFSFSKWKPGLGSLKVEAGFRSDVLVSFSGIPYHLRVRPVIEVLAKKCGAVVNEIEGDSEFSTPYVFAKVRNCAVQSVPRSITLEEKGEKFLIWVEVISEELFSLAVKPFSPVSAVVGEASRVEEAAGEVNGRRLTTGRSTGSAELLGNLSSRNSERERFSVQNSNSGDSTRKEPVEQVLERETTPRVVIGELQDGGHTSFVTSNPFKVLEVEAYDPDIYEPILPTEEPSKAYDRLSPEPLLGSSIVQPPPQSVSTRLRPIFQPVRNNRSRSRARNKGPIMQFGLGRHWWKNWQSNRSGRTRSRESRSRGRDRSYERERAHSGQFNGMESQRRDIDESGIREAAEEETLTSRAPNLPKEILAHNQRR
ncbi:hypothetical protein FRX31_011443 [Thalictrum thalictroides]|uniref:DUF4283 domain-containing protein n=2 Tax=Thalictrum thalictroides TaxID=46969 RepID=A0A7J6WS77_THATH|nr:hypothetical protein FRX31_011443 [Thalictrum thalictroides]